MPITSSTSALGATFNRFLFASVTGDAEAHLNVVSVLARLDLDPWQEAAELSRLRGEAAADRLASLLARCPGVILRNSDLGLMAQRLIALLPRSDVPTATSRDGRFATAAGLDRTVVIAVVLMVEMALMAAWGATGAHNRRNSAVAPRAAGSSLLPSLAAPPSAR